MSVDPARESVAPGEPGSWNRYGYTLANPLRLVDPDGQAPREWNERDWQVKLAAAGTELSGAVFCAPPEPGSFAAAVDDALTPEPYVDAAGNEIPLLIAGMPAPGGRGRVRAGQRGESAANLVEGLGPKTPFRWRGRDRISDGTTATVINEVKNARYLAMTRQLKDYVGRARASGVRFQLWVTRQTRLSAAVQAEVRKGTIKLRFFEIRVARRKE